MASTTLAQYRTAVAAHIGLNNASGSDEQTQIDRWVGEAYEDVVLRTHCKVRRASMSLTAAEQEYSLPTAAMQILDVYVESDSDSYPLERVTLQEAIQHRRASSAAAPPRVYVQKGDYLELYPAPASGDSLVVYYVPRPTALTANDAPSDVPAEWHQLIEFYALWRACAYDENRPKDEGLYWRVLYDRGITEMKRALGRRGGTRLAAARPGRSTRTIRSDPAVPIY